MKLLPLGTIINVNDNKLCIIGYGSVEKEATSISGYLCVMYPLGFTNIDKVLFIPYNLDFEIIVEGYKTIPSEQVLDTLAKSLEMVEKVSYDELLKFNAAYKKVASRKKEDA